MQPTPLTRQHLSLPAFFSSSVSASLTLSEPDEMQLAAMQTWTRC
jgi:hypothetical protein